MLSFMPRGVDSHCASLEVPENGDVTYTPQTCLDSATDNCTAMYTCDDGFYLSGIRTRRCMAVDGVWSGSDPTCRLSGMVYRNGIQHTIGMSPLAIILYSVIMWQKMNIS